MARAKAERKFMTSAYLEDRSVVRVAGMDARAFLQGTVTCDMAKATPGQAAYGALLTPQGKIIADFFVVEEVLANPSAGESFLLDAPRAVAPDLVKRLSMYRLRAKITIENLTQDRPDDEKLVVVARWPSAVAGSIWRVDPRSPALGDRAILRGPEAAAYAGDPGAYAAHRIALGIPEGGVDFAYGDAFPHEANLDSLRGVDFRKGCYVGQEVVSRVEHRGTARKRIASLRFAGAAPTVGTPIQAGELEIGIITSIAGEKGLAMIRLDRVKEAAEAGEKLVAGGIEVVVAP